jgi:hypothetical protein
VVIKADLGRSTLATTVLLILGEEAPGKKRFQLPARLHSKQRDFSSLLFHYYYK